MFTEFKYITDFEYLKGWDKYALKYQDLLAKDTVYYLTKELMHRIVDEVVSYSAHDNFQVLDINCGTGNDFPFFFNRGWTVTGCDGSEGMLNKTCERYESYLQSGQLNLYKGMIESLDENDFKGQAFDLIFSVTGGFAYVDDTQLLAINHQLSQLLKPEGWIVVAHLNRFCFAETAYRLLHLKRPLRTGSIINVNIQGESHRMYLRKPSGLKHIYGNQFQSVSCHPLLSFTPPYQTGYRPLKKTLKILNRLELSFSNQSWLSPIADQVVVTGRKK